MIEMASLLHSSVLKWLIHERLINQQHITKELIEALPTEEKLIISADISSIKNRESNAYKQKKAVSK